MVYTAEQCMFYVKRFYQIGRIIMVQHEFQKTSDCREGPRSTIKRLIKKFEQTDFMIANKIGIFGREKS
jgi:hypothetical protein